MTSRIWVAALAAAMAALAADPGPTVLTGTLTQREGKAAALTLPDQKLVELDGDPDTRGVLNDKRLSGAKLEVRGHYAASGKFQVDPIHTKAMHVHRNGKDLLITYWCDVCSIRTYTPGKCWCCQQETELDLREPDKLNEEK
jgi:hypothetical protein